MPGESLDAYLALARTVVPAFADMRMPDDPSDAELLAALRDKAWPPDELEGPLRRYAIRKLSKDGRGRPDERYRDTAIVYFVKAFMRCGMKRAEAIATIQELLPYGLSYDRIEKIVKQGGRKQRIVAPPREID